VVDSASAAGLYTLIDEIKWRSSVHNATVQRCSSGVGFCLVDDGSAVLATSDTLLGEWSSGTVGCGALEADGEASTLGSNELVAVAVLTVKASDGAAKLRLDMQRWEEPVALGVGAALNIVDPTAVGIEQLSVEDGPDQEHSLLWARFRLSRVSLRAYDIRYWSESRLRMACHQLGLEVIGVSIPKAEQVVEPPAGGCDDCGNSHPIVLRAWNRTAVARLDPAGLLPGSDYTVMFPSGIFVGPAGDSIDSLSVNFGTLSPHRLGVHYSSALIPANPPQNVRASDAQLDSVTVSWEPGEPGACVFARWVVLYRKEGDEVYRYARGFSCASLTARDRTTCAPNQLESAARYVFVVRELCRDGDSDSDASDPSPAFRTLPLPADPPLFPTITNVGVYFMNVTFVPGLPYQCVFASFMIQVRESEIFEDDVDGRAPQPASPWRLADGPCGNMVLRTVTDCAIESLAHQTSFQFRVKEICEDPEADSGFAVSDSRRTRTAVAAGSPVDLVATGAAPSYVTLSWRQGDGADCFFDHWEVSVRLNGTDKWEVDFVSRGCRDLKREENTCYVVGLLESQAYEFRLRERCSNPEATGAHSVASNIITTQRGTGYLEAPNPTAYDPRRQAVFVADADQHLVLRWAADSGLWTTVAGGGVCGFDGDGGAAEAALLCGPTALALEDSTRTLFVADTLNHRVRAVELDTGLIRTVAGSGRPGATGDGGFAIDADLEHPRAIVVTPGGAVLYIQDPLGRPDTVRSVDLEGGRIETYRTWDEGTRLLLAR